MIWGRRTSTVARTSILIIITRRPTTATHDTVDDGDSYSSRAERVVQGGGRAADSGVL